jgi:hypothetical protein
MMTMLYGMLTTQRPIWLASLAAFALLLSASCHSSALSKADSDSPLGEDPEALELNGQDWKVDTTLSVHGGSRGAPANWSFAAGSVAGKSLAPRVESIPTINEDTFNLFWNPKVQLSNLDLEVRVQSRSGEIDQGGGPVWRVQDRENYYICRVNPLESNFRLYKVVGGVRRQLASVKYEPAPMGSWHTIRVMHHGDKLSCSLDGKYRLEAQDTAILNSGGVGVWTKADALSWFEGFSVRRVD